MPTVMIHQSPRSPAVRAAAIASVTNALVEASGLRPEQVQVFVQEVPDDSRGRGGVPASGQRTAAESG
jgi:phenylpyruvate tautomerase PptA (4-oxalocrotonate tautomerase family)